MKKISVFLLAMVFIPAVNAQKSFSSGAFVMSANFGVDGNITTQHYTNAPQNSAATLNYTAPASNFNITGEYGLLNWLGLGLIGRFDNYFMENNRYTNTRPSAGAVDYGGTVNIHMVKVKHLDLFGGYDWGVSQFTYNLNDGANTAAYGNGTWSDIHVTSRFYFNWVGLNLCLYVPTMKYASLQNNSSSEGQYIVNYWKSTGYGASIGIQFRLF